MYKVDKAGCPEAELQLQDGSVLVFGGPYGNLEALKAVKKLAEARAIPASNVICTGDTAAYCAEPEECVALIRDWGIAVVQGNCEEALGQDAADCACGFEEGSTCSRLSEQWFAFNKQALSEDSKLWMLSLPKAVRYRIMGLRFVCVHGTYSQNNAFVFKSSPVELKKSEIESSKSDVLIAGHCGIPFGEVFQTEAGSNSTFKAWLNAGVVGMPANEGLPSVWVMLLNPRQENIEVHWLRLDYEYQTTMRVMREKNLHNGYHDALRTGRWPSTDILPTTEREQTGIALCLPELRLPISL